MSDRYACPDCGGLMWSTAKLTDPPIYEANCPGCGAVYRKRRDMVPAGQLLPRDYERIYTSEGSRAGDA